MAVVYVEGFDMYNGITNTATAGGASVRGTYAGSFSLAVGRFGGQALQLTSTGTSNKYAVLGLPASYPTGTLGFALSQISIFLSSAGQLISVGEQINLLVLNTNAIAVRRGTTVLGTTANNVFTLNSWCYIEMEYVVSTTVGIVNLYVNGAPVLSISGVNTQNQATDTTNTITISSNLTSGTAGANFLFDDMYLTDTVTRLGEQRVFTANVDADASPSDWAASGGAVAPYTMIDEVLCDGDTTYISSSTLNARAMFGVGNLPVSPTGIQAVQISSFGRKTDTGLRKIQLQYEDASANLYTSSEYTLAGGPGYGRQIDLLQNNPITTAGWTASEVNAMKIGVKVSA